MKKFITHFLIILAFFTIYILQTNFFNWFTINGIQPNLFIIYLLFIGLFAGRRLGITYGIIFGLIIDLISRENIGITSLMLASIGFLGGYFDKNFSKENRITIMLMQAGATVIYEIGIYIINATILTYDIEIIEFIKILLIEILFNTLITIVIYPILQKAGYSMEEVIKNRSNVLLTRYF